MLGIEGNTTIETAKKYSIAIITFILFISGCAETSPVLEAPGENTIPMLEEPDENAVPGLEAGPDENIVPGSEKNVRAPETEPGEKSDSKEETPGPEIPSETESNCIGFLVAAPDELKTVAMTGAAWARPHPGPFSWGWVEREKGKRNWELQDHWVKASGVNGIALLGTVFPYVSWDQAACRSEAECAVSENDVFFPRPEPSGLFRNHSIPASRCAPCSLENYSSFLGSMVERYDGDGIDDMEGLVLPVKYWEILNEPEMDSMELSFFKGTPEEYVEILRISFETIKQTCPDCVVVQGGAASSEKTNEFWEKIFKLGGHRYFDVANVHYISSGDPSTLNVGPFKQLMKEHGVNKPIWVTEAQLANEAQADSSTGGAITAGAEKVFYVSLIAGSMEPPKPGNYSKIYESMPEKCN